MCDESGMVINPGKNEEVEHDGKRYQCLAIKTHVVTEADRLEAVLIRYAKPVVKPGDILFISEKMVACAQGRAIPMDTIRPGRLARWLSSFVTKTPYGIGLGIPETMQCALEECGRLRILLAAAVGALGRLFGRRGWFYRIAGPRAAGIDGPCDCTLPPYNHYVVLTPRKPHKVAAFAASILPGVHVLIVDLNDLGGNILAASPGAPDQMHLLALLGQNPLGQGSQRTPMGILRQAG